MSGLGAKALSCSRPAGLDLPRELQLAQVLTDLS